MKKIDFGAPPPPPPELPRPVPTELYSPTQYSGVQQYSPSRATSPGSEDERPPPPTAASLPPRKVLGSDQAKRRLQAFAKSKMTNSPKGKVSAIFADEEDDLSGKERVEKKKGPMVKDSTPVMASIMKEETESRETIKKNMEKIAKKAEESDSERNKDESSRKFRDDSSEGDLRDLLKKKREVNDSKDSRRGSVGRRSRSKERGGGGGRSDKKRLERSPRDSKNRSSGDRGRRGRDSLSPEKNKKGRDESEGGKRRSDDRVIRRKQTTVEDESRERINKRKFDQNSPSINSEKSTSGFGKFGSDKKLKHVEEESPEKQKLTEVAERRLSKRSKDGSWESKERNATESKDVERGASRRRNSADSRDEEPSRNRTDSGGNAKGNRKRSADNRGERKFSGDRQSEKIKSESGDLRDGSNSALSFGRESRNLGELKDLRSGDRKEFERNMNEAEGTGRPDNSREASPDRQDKGRRNRKREDSWPEENFQRRRNFSSETNTTDQRDQGYVEEKAKPEKPKNIEKDIDLWELKHGNQNQTVPNDRVQRTEKFTNEIAKEAGTIKDQTIYIKAANDEDYQEIKQENRDTTEFVNNKEGIFLEFPCKYMQETSSGMTWSYNLEMCKSLDLEKKRSARIRQSIDSMVSELEHDTLKKRSRENSILSEVAEPVKRKKKKKSGKAEDLKKDKKKKKQKKDDASTKKLKKKKKKRDKDIDLDDEIFLPDISIDLDVLDQSMTSTNTSPDPKRKRLNSGSVPLSAAGMSKLFSMAGYDPSAKEQETRDEEPNTKERAGPGSLSPSPLKSKKQSSRMDKSPPPPRSDSRHSKHSKDLSLRDESTSKRSFSPGREEVFTPSKDRRSAMVGTPVQDDTDLPVAERILYENMPRRSLSERSPSPSLRGDLSRISGPRTPSPGPRLPKMKDSRSPSKVPIMRDRRSPLKQSPVRDLKSKDFSNERGKSVEKYESPKKKEGRRVHRSRDASPVGQFITEEDFIGMNYESLKGKREEKGRHESPRTSEHSGSSRRLKRSPGRFMSPGPSPRGSISSHKSDDRSSINQKRRDSPEPRSLAPPLDDDHYSRRAPISENVGLNFDPKSSPRGQIKRRSSPLRNIQGKDNEKSPGISYDPINESRDYSPEHRRYEAASKDVQGRKLFSPGQRDTSPGRRLSSPERRPVSPGHRQREEYGAERNYDRRYPRTEKSPRRRSSVSPNNSSPDKKNRFSDRRPRTPDRKVEIGSGSRDERQGTPDRRPGTPDRRPGTPDRRPATPEGKLSDQDQHPRSSNISSRSQDRKHSSPGRRSTSPSKGARSLEKRAFSPDKRPVSPSGRRLASPTNQRPSSPAGRRQISPGGRRPGSPISRRPSRSPGGRRYSSPADRRQVSPSNRRAVSPINRRPVSPGGRRLESPGGRRPISPGGRRPLSPGGRRPLSPGGRRPLSPGGRRPLSPGGRRPLSPGGRRPISPGGRRPLSPGGRRPVSPGGRRPLSPGGRRPVSPGGRRPVSPGDRRPVSPGGRRPLSPGGRRPASPGGRRPMSPSGRGPASPAARRQVSPGGRRPVSPSGRRPVSPGRRADSPGGRRPLSPGDKRPGSPNRRPLSPGGRPRSPGRGHSSLDRRPMSPGRRSPRNYERRPFSPDQRPRSPERMLNSSEHRPYSPDRDHRQRSPRSRDRRSPRPYSPGRKGYGSPGRARRPRTPPYSPGRRARTPESRRFSPDRERRPHSPGRRRFSPSYDPRDRNLPDSTISDADLARQMPPPSLHYKYKQFGSLASPAASGYSDSPKRCSLDERLEREHGIKIEHEQTPPMDFTRPPPGFPTVPGGPTFHPPAMPPGGPQLVTPMPFSAGLPAMIPTYDDSAPPTPVKGPPYPGSGTQKVANEKEQAIIAAQAVASKLQEMQAAKEDERKKKKEQKMAERLALMDAKREEKVQETKVVPVKVATGRIFDEVEKQEIEMKEKDVKTEVKDSEKKKHSEEKRRKKKDKDSPLLITLKPFYRPNEKKDKKKRKIEIPDPELTDEEFVPRSPVPLPDNSSLKPVLIKPNQTKLKLVSEAGSERKGVKYADGVLPGQGSPDQDFSPPAPTPAVEKPVKKKYKKVTITVITQHMGDTDSEEEGPPPPPPGSPPRYHLKDLIAMYGAPRQIESNA